MATLPERARAYHVDEAIVHVQEAGEEGEGAEAVVRGEEDLEDDGELERGRGMGPRHGEPQLERPQLLHEEGAGL